MPRASLLTTESRVEAPFIRVKIGDYTFGVYEGRTKTVNTNNGVITGTGIKYPNYIQDMTIDKINGTVNQYHLSIKYPITDKDDPNFFEKILSSVSQSRKIEFSYGDFMLPDYIYRNEEAIITKVNNNFDIRNSSISYNIEAVSTSSLSLSGTYTFPSVTAKPSDVIKQILFSSKYHLTDVFKGMRSKGNVDINGWIASDDKRVKIPTCANVSVLDYLSTLVSNMIPLDSGNDVIKSSVYSLTTYDDVTGSVGGAYFTVQKIASNYNSLNTLCTYEIDIGYPTSNVVTEFRIDKNENWSIFYNYNRSLDNSDYLKRISDDGTTEYIFSPQLTNGGFEMHPSDASWWTQVTQYPVSASLTLKGLLRPVILMQYVKLNVWFFGRKHISSGYYIIKKQQDRIGRGSYDTVLELIRVAPDEDMI